jgi:hypothetical protein
MLGVQPFPQPVVTEDVPYGEGTDATKMRAFEAEEDHQVRLYSYDRDTDPIAQTIMAIIGSKYFNMRTLLRIRFALKERGVIGRVRRDWGREECYLTQFLGRYIEEIRTVFAAGKVVLHENKTDGPLVGRRPPRRVLNPIPQEPAPPEAPFDWDSADECEEEIPWGFAFTPVGSWGQESGF